ncbi:hypothetical protein [Sphingobacterium multivorum]|uniref:hypothetical protein n=1 Tax=Sphingobacterium multivorum TaxID=28454 RepID=UPI0028B13099|nr:hypothetical protein [Sphingobacterium multivorum]
MNRKQLEGICRFIVSFESDIPIEEINKLFSLQLAEYNTMEEALSAYLEAKNIPLDFDNEINRQEEKQLRDHLSGLAMQGILSAQSEMRANGHCNTVEGIKYLADESYLIADAMLKARKEVSGE